MAFSFFHHNQGFKADRSLTRQYRITSRNEDFAGSSVGIRDSVSRGGLSFWGVKCICAVICTNHTANYCFDKVYQALNIMVRV
jgi:hypothetical protein